MTITKEDVKTIALTSAIAATGGVIASTIVGYFVERYLLKRHEGPSFVIVPVQAAPPAGVNTIEPQPVFAGFGALSPERERELNQLIPCWTSDLQTCGYAFSKSGGIDPAIRHSPKCAPYEPLFQSAEEDFDDTLAWVKSTKMCDYDRDRVYKMAALSAGLGALAAIGIVALASRS